MTAFLTPPSPLLFVLASPTHPRPYLMQLFRLPTFVSSLVSYRQFPRSLMPSKQPRRRSSRISALPNHQPAAQQPHPPSPSSPSSPQPAPSKKRRRLSTPETPNPTCTTTPTTNSSLQPGQPGQPALIYPTQHAHIPFSRPANSQILRLVSWNVASLRSITKAGSLVAYVEQEHPHVLCLQETKMTSAVESKFPGLPGYTVHWYHSERKGYSGVATFVRDDISSLGLTVGDVHRGLGETTADGEGRVLTLNLDPYFRIVNAYVPNAGGKLARLEYRTTQYEPAARTFLQSLTSKDVATIYCGDLNVAHEELDIHNSKGNKKSAGHTPQERAEFGNLLQHGTGWVDCYRTLYPTFPGYTYYSRRFGTRLREQKKGWRLDYFVMDKPNHEKELVHDCFVRPDVDGSDHYPLVLDLKIPRP